MSEARNDSITGFEFRYLRSLASSLYRGVTCLADVVSCILSYSQYIWLVATAKYLHVEVKFIVSLLNGRVLTQAGRELWQLHSITLLALRSHPVSYILSQASDSSGIAQRLQFALRPS